MGALLRLLGYAAQGTAARNPAFLPVLYLLPFAGMVLASAVLADVPLVPLGLKRLFSRASREAAT